MNKDKVKEILDKTNIYVLDEANIIEYIDELETKIYEALRLLKHNDIYDYRVFEEMLENILRGTNEED